MQRWIFGDAFGQDPNLILAFVVNKAPLLLKFWAKNSDVFFFLLLFCISDAALERQMQIQMKMKIENQTLLLWICIFPTFTLLPKSRQGLRRCPNEYKSKFNRFPWHTVKGRGKKEWGKAWPFTKPGGDLDQWKPGGDTEGNKNPNPFFGKKYF